MPTRQPTLLGVPYDASSSFLRGAAGAPAKIREALRSPSSNGWSEAGIDVLADGVLADAGDVAAGDDPAAARTAIEAAARAVSMRGGSPISLGGDHSITYPILKALGPVNRNLTIIQIDAHPDLYDEFEGDRFSHACQFARIMEERLAARLVQVGIRTANAHQREQAKKFNIDLIDMKIWQSRKPKAGGPTYISLDLDGLDPAFAPGVSHPEPGGLSVRDVLNVIQTLPGPIVGADIVELNPSRDVNGVTAVVAAKFVKEIANRMIETA